MQTASTPLTNALQQGLALPSKPRLIVEWNQNRYSPITTVDVNGSPEATNGYNLDLFPIESITGTVRPTAGLPIARAGESVATSSYSDDPAVRRYYTANVDAKYKYWSSQTPSSGTISGGSYPISNCQPYILYTGLTQTNKIYVCVENSWTTPVNWTVQITTDGSNWSTVATNQTVNATTGVLELYLQANNSWSTTVYRDNSMQIRGVRLVITSLDKASSYLSLIELGARLEKDLTAYLLEHSVDNEVDSTDFVFPIGTISSNEASVTLSNTDGLFNDNNSSSLYYGLIDANAKFTLDIGIDTTAFGGSGYEYVRQFTMYSENWETDLEKASVPLKDASKFLQEVSPNSLLMENVSVGEAVYRILDSVGFNSWAYVKSATEAPTTISYYWTDKTVSAWENIQSILRSTQSAGYFDEFGVFQIVTRNAAYNKSKASSWTLDGATNGAKQADIIDLQTTGQFEANKVTITYRPTDLGYDEHLNPTMETVWQPESSVVLRSCALAASMTNSQMTFNISPENAKLWPFSGMANIQGEIIRFDAKQYYYIDRNSTPVTVYLTNNDELLDIQNNKTLAVSANLSRFTGVMRIVERGYDNTYADTHDISINAWKTTGKYGSTGGAQTSWLGGISAVPNDSALRISTNSGFTGDKWYCVAAPTKYAGNPRQYGFRIRFPATPHGNESVGGYFFWSNASYNSMYAVDIQTTATLTKGNRRASSNEISLLKRNGGTITRLGGRGLATPIVPGQWVDVDVRVLADATIMVMVNGRLAIRYKDLTPLTETNTHGVYVRAFSVADFDYAYSTTASPLVPTNDPDDSDFLDIIQGGYLSTQRKNSFSTAYVDPVHKPRRGKKPTILKSGGQYFDEFGADVHEVRKYSVQFDKVPVVYSSPLFTNTAQVVMDEYIGTPFGAEFIIANAARVNAVVNGDDTLSFGVDNSVTHKLLITGRTIQQKDEAKYVVQNDSQIRARGEIALEISSDWIQNAAGAKALGDWIINNWSTPADLAEVEIFGNPLLQLTDVVSVNYTQKNMSSATHKFFITKISHSWDNGLSTRLSLRRAI